MVLESIQWHDKVLNCMGMYSMAWEIYSYIQHRKVFDCMGQHYIVWKVFNCMGKYSIVRESIQLYGKVYIYLSIYVYGIYLRHSLNIYTFFFSSHGISRKYITLMFFMKVFTLLAIANIMFCSESSQQTVANGSCNTIQYSKIQYFYQINKNDYR